MLTATVNQVNCSTKLPGVLQCLGVQFQYCARRPYSHYLLGYGIATGTVIFVSPKLHVHDARLH